MVDFMPPPLQNQEKKIKKNKLTDGKLDFKWRKVSFLSGSGLGSIQTIAKFLTVWRLSQRLWVLSACQRPMMSLFDTTDCFVKIGESLQPAGVPFTPRKQLGPDPCSAGPQSRGSFQAGRPRDPPRSHPPATSLSAAQITLFILCIIVSSWMRKSMATLEWIGLACVPAC